MIHKAPPRGRGKSPSYRLILSIPNTNRPVLEFVKDNFGGRVRGPFIRALKWRPSYRWEIEGQGAVSFLKIIRPYIKTKNPQSDLAVKFFEHCSKNTVRSLGKGHGSEPITESEIQVREEMYLEMKRLNKRGIA